MIIRGFRFGMLLQLAIGPVSLYIFQTATLAGLVVALVGVLGVALVDGLFILAAILGIAAIIKRNKADLFLRIFGAAILSIFGISTVLGVFGYSFIPSLNLAQSGQANNVFLRAAFLTAANPLTIVFWAGVFSSRLAEGEMNRQEINAFGAGALLSTLLFLPLVALVGTLTGSFLTPNLISLMNLVVGLLLVYYGIRMLMRKK